MPRSRKPPFLASSTKTKPVAATPPPFRVRPSCATPSRGWEERRRCGRHHRSRSALAQTISELLWSAWPRNLMRQNAPSRARRSEKRRASSMLQPSAGTLRRHPTRTCLRRRRQQRPSTSASPGPCCVPQPRPPATARQASRLQAKSPSVALRIERLRAAARTKTRSTSMSCALGSVCPLPRAARRGRKPPPERGRLDRRLRLTPRRPSKRCGPFGRLAQGTVQQLNPTMTTGFRRW
jgi:hypothetical protein